MNTEWVIALVNAGIVAAFGAFLMWRTHVSVARRTAALPPGPATAISPSVQREKHRRLLELRAEIRRLEQELGVTAGVVSSATGSPAA